MNLCWSCAAGGLPARASSTGDGGRTSGYVRETGQRARAHRPGGDAGARRRLGAARGHDDLPGVRGTVALFDRPRSRRGALRSRAGRGLGTGRRQPRRARIDVAAGPARRHRPGRVLRHGSVRRVPGVGGAHWRPPRRGWRSRRPLRRWACFAGRRACFARCRACFACRRAPFACCWACFAQRWACFARGRRPRTRAVVLGRRVRHRSGQPGGRAWISVGAG